MLLYHDVVIQILMGIQCNNNTTQKQLSYIHEQTSLMLNDNNSELLSEIEMN